MTALSEVADLIRARAELVPPGPWYVTGKSGRYGGLVAGPEHSHNASEVEGYGGRLIAESVQKADRTHLATWTPEVARALARLLDALATCEAVDAATAAFVAVYPRQVQA